jgi:phosphomannomutase
MAESRIGPASFLNSVPVPLAFGTSGLRGLVKDITDLEAYINVKAALRYLLSIGDIRAGGGVVIAGDLRPSTDRIMRACAQAIVDLGCRVENAGKIPTPALIVGKGGADQKKKEKW